MTALEVFLTKDKSKTGRVTLYTKIEEIYSSSDPGMSAVETLALAPGLDM